MSDASLEDCQEYLLARLARSKGQKIAASELRNSLSTAGARAVGLESEGAADRTIRHLVDEGYVEEQKRGSGPDAPIHHPRSGSTYLLTGKGIGLLESLGRRPTSRNAKPQPTHQSAPLLACQKAFILLQFLRVDGRAMTRSDLAGRLGTKTAKENLGLDRSTVEWVLSVLVEADYLTQRERGTGLSYKLTEDGVDFLAATEQYETARFTLTGKELNALISAVREARGPADRQAAVPGASVAPTTPAPRPPTDSIPPVDLKVGVLRLFEELRSERHAYTGMVPIHELRQRVAEVFGPNAAHHEALDDLIRGLQRDRRVRMVAISDLRDASKDELERSIPGMNETFFYIEAAHEPTGVR